MPREVDDVLEIIELRFDSYVGDATIHGCSGALSGTCDVLSLAAKVVWSAMRVKTMLPKFNRLRTHSNLSDTENQNEDDEEGECEEPTLGPITAIAVLVVTTVLVTLCAEYLVDGINGLATTSGISRVQTVAFAASVLVITYTIQDGKSNYLEGAMLMGLYIIIALAFYATPSDIMGASK
ncbi:hypothetical protein FOXB_16418 [Fusarium oxysporum f. sp. conglutinans Fo5176]|uniref:Sodium/calcium exchanger membrane region domain-containing protein n=3 Tax=Fusarium oxysporum f. sp. conglutinans TaxID=100902 RepID=F9GCN2_FUSOF|nr:hypothetical protein FOXB_16418 [Fusarium oxysporum f. sp. conglutinans Fo5176]